MAPTQATLDEYQIQEELALYSSLCLLEVPSGDGAKQTRLSKTMFRKQNLKCFEYIICHCYAAVNGKAAAKRHLRWPYDAKDPKQKKEFYTSAVAWLKESGVLETYGNTLEPFKRNPQGPRLVSFLLDLVTYTISTQHGQMYPDDVASTTDIRVGTKDAQLLSLLREPIITAAKAQNQLQTERLLRAFAAGSNLQQQAEESAGCFSSLYYSLKAQLWQAHAQVQLPVNTAAMPSVPQHVSCTATDQSASSNGGSSQHYHQPVKQLPEELIQQYRELEGLWMQLEQHMQQSEGLTLLVDGLTRAGVHPHAIDAMRLRQCGKLPMAPSTPGLDIAAMMEAWLVDVGAVCRYTRHLAGQRDTHADLGPGSLKGAESCGVTPLLATADASSHAPHLYAQLCLHANCLDHLKSLKAALGARMATAAEHIQQLEQELYGLMAVQQQECLAAMGPAASLAAQDAPCLLAQCQLKPALKGATLHGTAASLFNSSNLPLIPPTPVLQQLVQNNGTGTHVVDTAVAVAAANSNHNIPSPSLSGIADQPDNSSTPRMSAAAMTELPAGSVSSVSSAAMPAAALLLSQEFGDELMNPELIDLDLIDLTDDTDPPASPVLDSKQVTVGSNLDFLRLSMRNVSYLGRAGAVQVFGQPHQQKVPAVVPAALSGSTTSARIQVDFVREQAAGVQLGQLLGSSEADTPPHIGAGKCHATASPRSDLAATSEAQSLEGTKAGVVDDGSFIVQQGPSHLKMPGTSVASVVDAVNVHNASNDSSPLTAAPSGQLAEPMVPLSGPESDCLSTARPRRLTFAAAVSGDADSSAAFGNQGSSCPSLTSSEVSSEPPATAESSAVEPGLHAGLSLSLLRQRFAAAQQQ